MIKIRYDIQHYEIANLVKDSARKVADRRKVEINLELCDGYSLLEKLSSNPKYDFVILHLGTNNEGAYSQAEKCRKIAKAHIIADSSTFPFGTGEVLRHFDYYIPTIMKPEYLEDLLSNYDYI